MGIGATILPLTGIQPQVCDICGCSEYAVVSRMGRFNTPLQNVVCKSCGLVYVNPRPDRQQIDDFYREQYDSSGLYFRDDIPAEDLDESALRAARSRFWFLMTHWSGLKPGRALEVGCGAGTFLGLLKRQSWEIWGVEPVPRLARHAAEKYQATISQGLFEGCDFGGKTFDLISMFHVLEHFFSPSAGLRKCRRLLAREGLLYLEVPDLFHPNRACPEEFFQAAHLSTFSANTLAQVLAKERFDILVLERCGHFLRSIARPGDPSAAARPGNPGRSPIGVADLKDDWRVVIKMVHRRRRWYPLTGWWRDLFAAVGATSRALLKHVVIALLGRQRGKRVISLLRRS